MKVSKAVIQMDCNKRTRHFQGYQDLSDETSAEPWFMIDCCSEPHHSLDSFDVATCPRACYCASTLDSKASSVVYHNFHSQTPLFLRQLLLAWLAFPNAYGVYDIQYWIFRCLLPHPALFNSTRQCVYSGVRVVYYSVQYFATCDPI